MEVTQDGQLVPLAGLDGMDVDVSIQEGRAASKSVDRRVTLELAIAFAPHRLPGLHHRVEELTVGVDLLADGGRVRGVVMLELFEERMVRARRAQLDGVHDARTWRLASVVDELHLEVALEEGDQLRAKLHLCRVHLAVGLDQRVHGLQQDLLAFGVECLEELEAAQLQLGVDEGVLIFVVRHGLREEVLHVLVDVLEDLVEVRRET